MVRLVTVDSPDVVCLQEVPLWSLGSIEEWSGMRAFHAVTTRSLLGRPGRRLQTLDPVHVRSVWTGQSNVLLIGSRVEPVGSSRAVHLSRDSRWQHRTCQLLPVRAEERLLVIANLHASNDESAARDELNRVAAVVSAVESAIVCGDFNVPATGLPEFSNPIAGIDQIVVRGLEVVAGPDPWPIERRRIDGHVWSDHAPIEAAVA